MYPEALYQFITTVQVEDLNKTDYILVDFWGLLIYSVIKRSIALLKSEELVLFEVYTHEEFNKNYNFHFYLKQIETTKVEEFVNLMLKLN